jgi:hypothetical protein
MSLSIARQNTARRPARKGPASQTTQNGRAIVSRPPVSVLFLRLVEDELAELHASGETREYSVVLARHFGCTEERIDQAMAVLMLQHRAVAATLRSGMVGALAEAERAARGMVA